MHQNSFNHIVAHPETSVNGHEKLAYALKYAEIGWRVLPLRGKIPILKQWTERATTDPETIRKWWDEVDGNPNANIGIATGGGSGIIVLDVDSKNGGIGSLRDLIDTYGPIPQTVKAKTGGGGYHFFFKAPEWWVSNKVNLPNAPGLDIRGDGGQVVVYPSVHPATNNQYEWVEGCSPFEIEPADLPEWLAALLKKAGEKEVKAAREQYKGRVCWDYVEGQPITEGTRDVTLFKIGCSMRARGFGYEDILATLHEVNQRRCVPPMTEQEVRTKAEQAAKYDPGKKPEGRKRYEMTDAGNAERFADRHGVDIKYSPQFGWLVWDGTRWIKDESGEVMRRAIETVRSIKEEAAAVDISLNPGNADYRDRLFAHAKASESLSRLKAMIELAKAQPGITVDQSQFDADPWLLNVMNGTLDLRTGQIREHRREDMITKLAPVEYNPSADCPRWKQFLQEIFDNDKDMIDFVQRAAGYALTGDTSEQVMFFLYGSGKNGKSKFLGALQDMLGDYAQQAPNSLLTAKAGDSVPNDVARLKGARFVTTIETDEGKRMAEALVKQLTGGDKVTARFLRQEFFEFKPEAKIFLASNHKPIIRGSDDGIWRRIRLIPFEVQIPKEKQDKNLDEKFRAQLSGILNWAMEGLKKWREDGLKEPEKVLAATQAYRAEMDSLGQFLEDCCILAPNAQAAPTDLYRAYTEWCADNGEHAMNSRMFKKRLEERGYQQAKITGGKRVWKGIGLPIKSGPGFAVPPLPTIGYHEAAATSETGGHIAASRGGMMEGEI